MEEESSQFARVRRPPRTTKKDSGKFKRLKSLDCFPEVHDRLAKGFPPSQVASMVQNQFNEYVDIQHTTLTSMMRDYYKEEIPSTEKVANQLPAKFDEEIRDFQNNVDVLKEYTSLFDLQRQRIDIAVNQEKEAGTLLKNTGREIKIAAELLDRIKGIQDEKGLNPHDLSMFHEQAGLAIAAEAATGADAQFLMSAKRRGSVLDFLQKLDSTDPRIVEAIVIDQNDEPDDIEDAEFEECEEDAG